MKSIRLKDVLTGEVLDIQFDSEENTININGIDVERKRALEDAEDEFVFGFVTPGTTKLYHLSRVEIEQMRDIQD